MYIYAYGLCVCILAFVSSRSFLSEKIQNTYSHLFYFSFFFIFIFLVSSSLSLFYSDSTLKVFFICTKYNEKIIKMKNESIVSKKTNYKKKNTKQKNIAHKSS